MENINSRYAKQTMFAKIGTQGQRKLQNAHVVIVGCGALGSVQAELLARAGIGTLTLLDRDILEKSNLQRQFLYDEQQVEKGLPKAIAAKQRLEQINSQIKIHAEVIDIDYSNIESYVKSADLLLDATDNFETRFLLNDACIKHNKPWIYGAVVGSYGLTMPIIPQNGPCLRCIFEEAPDPGTTQTCDTSGVIAPIVSIIASFQVTETLKILTGNQKDCRKGLLSIDLWENQFFPMSSPKPRSNCITCQQKQFHALKGKERQLSTVLCGRNSVQLSPSSKQNVNLQKLAEQLGKHGKVTQNPFLIRCQIEDFSLTVFADGRTLITGTSDPIQAKSIHARYIGS